MTASVFINGRFLGQAVTGVQRFSLEITSAIDGLMAGGEWPETIMLTPRSHLKPTGPAVRSYGRIGLREVGRQHGHAWEQMDLPHAARNGTLVSLGNTAPFFAGRRQVVVIHDAGVFDTPDSYSLRFRLWYKGLQHALVRAGAKIVTVSEFSRGRIATRLGLDPAQIAVMYEGADHILGVVPDPTTLARHGLEPGRFALVVGSSVAHKNLDALREVSEALAKRNMVIAIVGGSNAEVFQDIGPGGSIGKRLGRSTDAELRALYENAACLLFPSRYEGFGLPPVEAMACGCPVIASRGGAVEEICKDAALYVDTRNGAELVRAVEELLDTPGLAANFVARGHSRVAGMTWKAAARVLADVVRPLC
jgi:glycosyltransferase involved in cell wall biosynthesis